MMKVIYRMYRNPYIGINECMAVLPDMPAKRGYVCDYVDKEGFGECSLDFYSKMSRPALPEEYAALHKIICEIYEGEDIRISKKIMQSDLKLAWSEV